MKRIIINKKTEILICFLMLCLGGMVSVWFKQDRNWDLINYHIYNPWALLNHRYGVDIFPSGLQSYYNPLLDVPYYVTAVEWLPNNPVLVAFLAGLPYGLLVFLTWLITNKVGLDPQIFSPLETKLAVLTACIIGVTGSTTIAQIGTTFNEIQTAILNLAALYLILLSNDEVAEKRSRWLLFLSGVLMGLAAGLKLTSIIYTCGGAVAVIATSRGWRKSVSNIFVFSIAWLVFFALVYGWWGYLIWQMTGNPMFPYFNNIFKSPWFPPEKFQDLRFVPQSTMQAIFYPFFWQDLKKAYVAEFPFSDFRIALAYLGVIIFAGSWIYRTIFKIAGRNLGNLTENNNLTRRSAAVMVFFVVSYIAWEYMFSIYRYIVPLEVLSGVVVMVGISISGLVRKNIPIILVVILGILSITTYKIDWGRADYASRTFLIESQIVPENSIVILSTNPMSFVAPFIKTKTGEPPAFFGIEENSYNYYKGYELDKIIARRLKDHDGPVFVLSREEVWAGDFLFSAYGIRINLESCTTVGSNIDAPYTLCATD